MFGLFGGKKKDYEVSVNNGAATFTVKAGDNLLKAALESGIAWPHDCRVGSCGSCACTITSGKIKQLTDFSYVLDGDQLKSGMALACQAALKSDLQVEVELGEEIATEMLSVKGSIERVIDLTHDIKELVFKADDVNFDREMLAGQYAEILVEGVSDPRSYSFAKAPNNENPGEFTFYIRHVPGGAFTDWLFAENRVGTAMSLNAPYGQFYHRPDDSMMVCMAGGSGMSAIKSLLEACVEDQVQRNCIYLFGARTEDDLYCAEDMEKIKAGWNKDFTFDYVPVLSADEGSNWTGPKGYVTDYFQQNYIDNSALDINNAQGYLCGPPAMIDSAIELLKSGGIAEESIYYDKFLDASSIPGGR
jgi:NAD(P)H-flavin reductase/ferredoxin